jgi:hypothetical protein
MIAVPFLLGEFVVVVYASVWLHHWYPVALYIKLDSGCKGYVFADHDYAIEFAELNGIDD